MDSIKVPEMDVTRLEVLVREDIEKCLQEVTAAVNKARVGAMINDSEEPVRQAIARLRQAVYQKAIQMKADAADAAFSPSVQWHKVMKQRSSAGRL